MTPISDIQAYNALLQLAEQEGYQVNTRTSRGTQRGPMEFKGVLKQGGPSITNEVLAELARMAAKSGTVDPALAQAFLRLSKNLEAAATVAQTRRKTKAALEEATAPTPLPSVGRKAVTRTLPPEAGAKKGKTITEYVPAKTPTRNEVISKVRTPIRAASGRPLAVQTADGKLHRIELSPTDYTHLVTLAQENPEASGWYQHQEGFDPVVSTEMFDEPMRQSVLRKTLERMKAAGQYGKGAKIVEVESNLPVERVRRSNDISGVNRETPEEAQKRVETNMPTEREHPTMVSEFLKGAAEESLASRTPTGQIRGGTPVVGRKGTVSGGKEFEYDLPAGVDQTFEEGKFLFTHPGSNKPVPIEEVEAYYRANAFRGGKPNPQMMADLAKVTKARQEIKYQAGDTSAADVALDKAAARKSREPEKIDIEDPYQVSERRAFKARMREEMTASDRRAQNIREAMEGTEFTKHEQAPKPLIGSEAQHKKLEAAKASLIDALKSQDVPASEIAAIVKEAIAPFAAGARRLGVENMPGKRGGRAWQRGTIENFPNLGTKAIDVGGGPMSERAGSVIVSRQGLSKAIKNLQKAEIAARLKGGQTEEQLKAAGLPLSYRKPGSRPFDAAKTKSAVTSPFARTRGEEGYVEGALHNKGQALRMQIEDDVRELVKQKPTAKELHKGLVSLMDQYGETQGLSPSSFMRIAKGVHPRIEELEARDITTALQERQDKLRYEPSTYKDAPEMPSMKMFEAPMVANQLAAAKEQAARRENALAILAELAPQLYGEAPEGLGVEIPMSTNPAARPDRPAEEVVARAERLGQAAKVREQQKAEQALQSRVAARLRELQLPATSRRVQRDLRRQATGEDLKQALRTWLEMLGPEGAEAVEIRMPQPGRLEGLPGPVEIPAEILEMVQGAPRAGYAHVGPHPYRITPEELKLQEALRARKAATGSYRRRR